ncbi:MAG: RsmG family class I SAM-dependent methyltransferase [Pseudomonadota bacterium]
MFKTFVNTFPAVPPEMYHKIILYYEILTKWNQAHNLVQRNTLVPSEFEKRHLIDCWQLIPHFSKEQPILDIGSGAGLPGVLLAIAGFNVHLCEIDLNKLSFLKVCISHLELNCSTKHSDANLITDKYTHVSSRAFSKLSNLLKVQWNVSRETKGVYLKGANYKSELDEAARMWDFEVKLINSKSSHEGMILLVTKLSPKNHCSHEAILQIR